MRNIDARHIPGIKKSAVRLKADVCSLLEDIFRLPKHQDSSMLLMRNVFCPAHSTLLK